MKQAFEDVRAFEERLRAGSRFRTNGKTIDLRRNLISEEYHETMVALDRLENAGLGEDFYPALAEVADGLADLIWVCVGTAAEVGIDLPAVWEEVRRSNMAKFAPGHTFREDGKLLKPPGWKEPDILGVIKRSKA